MGVLYNRCMNKRVISGMFAGFVGVVCLVIGFWKFARVPFEVPVVLRLGEQATLSGEVPSRAWVGDQSALKIKFKIDSPIQSTEAHLSADIEMADAEISPKGVISFTFNPENNLDLTWQIIPHVPRTLDGTLWIYASPDKAPLQAILARSIQIKAVNLLGVTAVWYRRLGLGFLVLGIFLVIAFTKKGSKSTG